MRNSFNFQHFNLGLRFIITIHAKQTNIARQNFYCNRINDFPALTENKARGNVLSISWNKFKIDCSNLSILRMLECSLEWIRN